MPAGTPRARIWDRADVLAALEFAATADVGLLTAPRPAMLDYAAANDLIIVSADATSASSWRPTAARQAFGCPPPLRRPAYEHALNCENN